MYLNEMQMESTWQMNECLYSLNSFFYFLVCFFCQIVGHRFFFRLVLNSTGQVKQLLTHLCWRSLPALKRKKEKRNMVVPLCCGYYKAVKYDSERSLKEEKRWERQTKREMEWAKDMLSFVLLARWQHLMNGLLWRNRVSSRGTPDPSELHSN